MFLAIFVCQIVLVAANPFHKYPYVFLLDVGNEELEKTNTEQIRLSVPGGSLALRYPAIGDGDTIAHVRVSGIDFGTDLKANIVDGGPGYKYVVIVFIGNSKVPYDAVMTVQTVSDSDMESIQNNNEDLSKSNSAIDDANDSAEVIDSEDVPNEKVETKNASDANDSSEDTSDDTETENLTNSQLKQESSNVYNVVNNDADADNGNQENDNDDDENDESGEDEDDESDENKATNDEKDIHTQYTESIQDVQMRDYNKYDDTNYHHTVNQEGREPIETNDDYDGNSDEPTREFNNNLYDNYAAIKPNLYDGVRIYPQNAVPFVERERNKPVFNQENSVEFAQAFNDGDSHNQPEKYIDTNNNFLESDDSSAVAS